MLLWIQHESLCCKMGQGGGPNMVMARGLASQMRGQHRLSGCDPPICLLLSLMDKTLVITAVFCPWAINTGKNVKNESLLLLSKTLSPTFSTTMMLVRLLKVVDNLNLLISTWKVLWMLLFAWKLRFAKDLELLFTLLVAIIHSSLDIENIQLNFQAVLFGDGYRENLCWKRNALTFTFLNIEASAFFYLKRNNY